MPNRYEREIEEILRNLEQTEPKQRLGQQFSGRLRRKEPPMRRPRRLISLHFSTAEWLLITAIVAALLSGGYAYAQHTADLFTGIVACIGMVCLILVTFSYYLLNPRQPSRSMRYGNVTITPLRRAPLTNLRTRWNLFKLKMKYRRNNSR